MYRWFMQFMTAVRLGFINYTNFKTRSSRSSYWYWVLFTVIVQFATLGSQSLSDLASLVLLLPSIAVGVRRMHDINRSGWWILFPIYNIVLACQPSYFGPNAWGPPEPPVSVR